MNNIYIQWPCTSTHTAHTWTRIPHGWGVLCTGSNALTAPSLLCSLLLLTQIWFYWHPDQRKFTGKLFVSHPWRPHLCMKKLLHQSTISCSIIFNSSLDLRIIILNLTETPHLGKGNTMVNALKMCSKILKFFNKIPGTKIFKFILNWAGSPTERNCLLSALCTCPEFYTVLPASS